MKKIIGVPLCLAGSILMCSCTLGSGVPPENVFITPMVTQPLPTVDDVQPVPDFPELSEPVQILEEMRVAYTGNKTLEVYFPAESGSWPVVVALHGGNSGARSLAGLARAIASQGAVVFVPSYFSSPPPPDHITIGLEEVGCALRYVEAYAVDYGGDPDRLIVIGHSGGGAAGAVMMFAGSRFTSEGCAASGGQFVPDAFVGLDGAYDLTRYIPEERLKAATEAEWLVINPFSYVHTTRVQPDQRFLLFTGVVPELRQQAQLFRSALSAAGYDVSEINLPGMDHLGFVNGTNPEINRAIRMLLLDD